MTPSVDTPATPATAKKRTFKEDLRHIWNEHWISITLISLIGVFTLAYLSNRIFVSVYPGQAMVLYHRFSDNPVPNETFGEGFYIIAPWNIAYKYDVSFQQMTVPVVALAKNGLEVMVDSFVMYRPVYHLIPHLHRRYGPRYADKIVVPQLRTTIQDIVGQFLPEEMYSLARNAQHEQVYAEAQRIIGGVYVDIGAVSIINIRLPSKVQSAIQAKLEEQQMVELYTYRVEREKKEAARKFEEAKGIADFQRTIAGGITPEVLKLKGIEATLELAKSPNSKVVVFGNTPGAGLPLILGNEK